MVTRQALFASCLREASCLERGPRKRWMLRYFRSWALTGGLVKLTVVTVGSSGVGNQGYFWKLSPFPLPVASWQCQIRSETEIAPVEFSIEMNTYRVVTQVIEKAKKELLRCHPGSSFRKRSCVCAWGTGTTSG